MKIFLALPLIVSISAFAAKPTKTCEDWLKDPYIWMEEVQGEKPLAWVTEQNAITQSVIEGDPEYAAILADVRGLLMAKDRQPFSEFDHGYYWNFWRDAEHPQGIYRRTTFEEYKKAEPLWETILDFDALSKAEGKKWGFHGITRLADDSSRVVIEMSDGGKDAVVLREFDLNTLSFVENGFNIPQEGKIALGSLDEDSLYIGTDFGPGSLTDSGYPRTVRLWKRGEDLANAKEVFAGNKTDVSVGVDKWFDGEKDIVLFIRRTSFRAAEWRVAEGGNMRVLPLPPSAKLMGIREGYLYFILREPLTAGEKVYAADSLLRTPLANKTIDTPELLWTPSPSQTLDHVQVRNGRLMVTYLEHMRTRVLEMRETATGWLTTELDLPRGGVGTFSLPGSKDPTDFSRFDYEDYMNPRTQYRVFEEGGGKLILERLRQTPERFNPDDVEALQLFATSTDGTKIPYTVVKNKNMVYDGKNPTILNGYGGFESSKLPSYQGFNGRVWLSRGGVYVIANIRGGGEYGPKWHQAALRENRQVAFDDFAAIAEDLIARKITSPKHLGIEGGSNGGLLTGTVLVQRPDLINAALVSVPLLDMLRYHKLLAGASWMEEYGNPDRAKDREWLLKYSPYQNVRPEGKYPRPLFYTSTFDDRVHPAHARKMAARMQEQGHPYLYFEDMDGGHGGDADIESTARMWARVYTYFWLQLKR